MELTANNNRQNYSRSFFSFKESWNALNISYKRICYVKCKQTVIFINFSLEEKKKEKCSFLHQEILINPHSNIMQRMSLFNRKWYRKRIRILYSAGLKVLNIEVTKIIKDERLENDFLSSINMCKLNA